MCHGTRRDASNELGESVEKARAQRPHGHGHHEVNDAQNVPHPEPPARRKGRLADQFEHHPRRGETDRHVAQPGRERERSGKIPNA